MHCTHYKLCREGNSRHGSWRSWYYSVNYQINHIIGQASILVLKYTGSISRGQHKFAGDWCRNKKVVNILYDKEGVWCSMRSDVSGYPYYWASRLQHPWRSVVNFCHIRNFLELAESVTEHQSISSYVTLRYSAFSYKILLKRCNTAFPGVDETFERYCSIYEIQVAWL